MTQEEYIAYLKEQVKTYGMAEFARRLGVTRMRIYEELKNPHRKYGKHDSNKLTQALGLRRTQVVRYDPIPGGMMDPARREKEAEVV
jgi:DNA-binding phage protein